MKKRYIQQMSRLAGLFSVYLLTLLFLPACSVSERPLSTPTPTSSAAAVKTEASAAAVAGSTTVVFADNDPIPWAPNPQYPDISQEDAESIFSGQVSRPGLSGSLMGAAVRSVRTNAGEGYEEAVLSKPFAIPALDEDGTLQESFQRWYCFACTSEDVCMGFVCYSLEGNPGVENVESLSRHLNELLHERNEKPTETALVFVTISPYGICAVDPAGEWYVLNTGGTVPEAERPQDIDTSALPTLEPWENNDRQIDYFLGLHVLP